LWGRVIPAYIPNRPHEKKRDRHENKVACRLSRSARFALGSQGRPRNAMAELRAILLPNVPHPLRAGDGALPRPSDRLGFGAGRGRVQRALSGRCAGRDVPTGLSVLRLLLATEGAGAAVCWSCTRADHTANDTGTTRYDPQLARAGRDSPRSEASPGSRNLKP
jgi:hypothetical protein